MHCLDGAELTLHSLGHVEVHTAATATTAADNTSIQRASTVLASLDRRI
jgi:hypothetical protein